VLENWQKTSLQQLVNTSVFRPFEIPSIKVATMEERKKKPFINERNRRKRLEFARAYVDKPIDFWKTVLFSDESKFNMFGSDGPQYVWRKPKKELDPKNQQSNMEEVTQWFGAVWVTQVWENLQLLKGL
jgi:hypothetical protein